MKDEIVIVTGCTSNYAKNLNILLSSIIHTNPELDCIVYCFGWDDELIQSFSNAHKANFVNVGITPEIEDDVRNNKRSGGALKLKIKYIHDALKENKHRKGILWIDTDSVVTKSIDPLLSVLASGEIDIACTRRKHRRLSHEIFALGVIGLTNSKAATEFMIELNEKIDSSKGVNDWFHDQLEFHNVFMEKKPKFYPLNRDEHTMKGVTDSMIYSRREVIELTPAGVASLHGIPIIEIGDLPESIYPI